MSISSGDFGADLIWTSLISVQVIRLISGEQPDISTTLVHLLQALVSAPLRGHWSLDSAAAWCQPAYSIT